MDGENLKTGTIIDGATAQTDNGVIEKYCYDNNCSNCDTYLWWFISVRRSCLGLGWNCGKRYSGYLS